MPLDPARLAEALPIAALVLLLMPKRGVGDLKHRFGELTRGRRWLFEPPAGWAIGAKGQQRVIAETLRALDLGIPLYVAARFGEERSARARLEARERWSRSAEALMSSHLSGAIAEDELLSRLDRLGMPPPPAKAIGHRVIQRSAESIQWWLEREEVRADGDGPVVDDGDGFHQDGEPSTAPGPPVELPAAFLAIDTLGQLSLRQDGKELGPELMKRPVPAYIWLYVFLRTLINPKDRVTRAELAEELTPGISTEKQRSRLRNRLSDIQHGSLPSELASRLVEGDEALTLDLTKSRVDLLALEEVAATCAAQEGLLPPDLANEAAELLDKSMGEFVPGWEQLEKAVNGGRGSVAELVQTLRQRAESARLNLMGSLAANHVARREPRRAIPILEQALERQPARADLARQLRAAYIESGQQARAAELEKDHTLDA